LQLAIELRQGGVGSGRYARASLRACPLLCLSSNHECQRADAQRACTFVRFCVHICLKAEFEARSNRKLRFGFLRALASTRASAAAQRSAMPRLPVMLVALDIKFMVFSEPRGMWDWRLVGVVSEAIMVEDFERITAVQALIPVRVSPGTKVPLATT
jgi:hypothetical protein